MCICIGDVFESNYVRELQLGFGVMVRIRFGVR